VNPVNRFAWTPLGAALLLAVPVVTSQAAPPATGGPHTSAGNCVIAGPSYGDCGALGRYAQSYRDVEGGVREAGLVAGRQAATGEQPRTEDAMTPKGSQVRRNHAP
jgi:hypothetical protein